MSRPNETKAEQVARQKVLGARIRSILEKKGETISGLAARIGWSRSELSKMLSGHRTISTIDLPPLAEALGVEWLDFMPPEWRSKQAQRGAAVRLIPEGVLPDSKNPWPPYDSLPETLREFFEKNSDSITIREQRFLFHSVVLVDDGILVDEQFWAGLLEFFRSESQRCKDSRA